MQSANIVSINFFQIREKSSTEIDCNAKKEQATGKIFFSEKNRINISQNHSLCAHQVNRSPCVFGTMVVRPGQAALLVSKQDPVDDLNDWEDGDPKEDSKPAGHVHQDLRQGSLQVPFILWAEDCWSFG